MTKDAEAPPNATPAVPSAKAASSEVTSMAMGGIAQTREAAKWLIGALGAVAVLLLAGTQLSSIGEADGWRLALATLCVVLGLSALTVALFATFRLLAPVSLSLDQLARRGWDRSKDPAIRYLRENSSVFQGEAANVAELQAKLAAARDAARTALAKSYAKPEDAGLEARAEAADQPRLQLSAIATSVTAFATYATLAQLLASWERRMAAALIVVGLALVGFAWAANPPDEGDEENKASAVAPDMRGVILQDIDLSGTNLSGIDFSYASLIRVNLRGAVTDGATWQGVVWEDVTCVDATNSDDVGHTCNDHLGAK